MQAMKMSVAPVVRVAVAPKNGKDALPFIEGLKHLAHESMVVVSKDPITGQHIVAGVGKLHLEICLNDLETKFAGVEITRSEPITSYRETVTAEGERCLAKSSKWCTYCMLVPAC